MKNIVDGVKELFANPVNTILIILVGIMAYLGGLFTENILPILTSIAETIPPTKLLIFGILALIASVVECIMLYRKYNEDIYENAFGAFWKYNKRSKSYEKYPYCPHCKSVLTNYRRCQQGEYGGRYAFDCVHCKTIIVLSDDKSNNIHLDGAHQLLKHL